MGSHFKRFIIDGMLSLKSGGLMLLLTCSVLLIIVAAYFVSKHIKSSPLYLAEFPGKDANL